MFVSFDYDYFSNHRLVVGSESLLTTAQNGQERQFTSLKDGLDASQ